MEAITRSLAGGKACRYPYGGAGELVNLIAQKEGVPSDHIVLGAGSGELLEKGSINFGLMKGEDIYAAPGYERLVTNIESWLVLGLPMTRANAVPLLGSKGEEIAPSPKCVLARTIPFIAVATDCRRSGAGDRPISPRLCGENSRA
jgi:hypothetical protein